MRPRRPTGPRTRWPGWPGRRWPRTLRLMRRRMSCTGPGSAGMRCRRRRGSRGRGRRGSPRRWPACGRSGRPRRRRSRRGSRRTGRGGRPGRGPGARRPRRRWSWRRRTWPGCGPPSRPRSMTGRRVTPRRWPPRASRCAAARRFPRAGIAGAGEPKRAPAAPGPAGQNPLAGAPRVPAGRHCRVREAEAKLEATRARAAQAGRKAAEREAARKGPGPVRTITDPDSRLMPVRGGGFIQGYNTQDMPSQDELIIATELTGEQAGCPSFEPMLAKGQQAAALIAAHRPAAGQDGGSQDQDGIGQVLADAGYCSEAHMTCPVPDRLIATGKGRDLEKAARDPDGDGPGWGGPAIQAMRERLKTPEGIAAYRQRGHIAETPHGHIKHNMGLRQLSVRGKRKASAEWTFAAAVHNLFKAISAGHLTSQALDALAATPA